MDYTHEVFYFNGRSKRRKKFYKEFSKVEGGILKFTIPNEKLVKKAILLEGEIELEGRKLRKAEEILRNVKKLSEYVFKDAKEAAILEKSQQFQIPKKDIIDIIKL